jgi:NADPH:quinone reductase
MLALVPTGSSETMTQVRDVEIPVPGENEALVKISDFSLNRADFLYLSSPSSDFRPGIDAAGIVEVPAADGSGPAAGTRVVLHLPTGGGAAEYVAASADRMAVIPDGVPSHVAAAIPLAGLVAQRLLAEAGPLRGRTILATGVGGGVGQFLIQLAVADGAEVIAVAADGQPFEHMADLGARVVRGLDAVEAGTIDIVVESVGGDLGSQAARMLRPGGLFLWFGQASAAPITLDFFQTLQACSGLTLRHFVYSDGDGSRDAKDMATLLDLAGTGRLRVEVGYRGDWNATAAVLTEMAAGRLRGKAVLSVV